LTEKATTVRGLCQDLLECPFGLTSYKFDRFTPAFACSSLVNDYCWQQSLHYLREHMAECESLLMVLVDGCCMSYDVCASFKQEWRSAARQFLMQKKAHDVKVFDAKATFFSSLSLVPSDRSNSDLQLQ
jgi:hypothetical protein